jgi:hypothetical protein
MGDLAGAREQQRMVADPKAVLRDLEEPKTSLRPR